MQEDVKEGIPWKSSFTSGNVHDDGYLFLLQQHSAQTGYFMRIQNVTKKTLKDKIKRRGNGDGGRGTGMIPVKRVPISTVVPLHNFRSFINGRVGLIGVFEYQICHIENGDTVIGRVGRRHIRFVMPFAADHDHLICCLSSVASVCRPGEEAGRVVGSKPAKGGEGENKELVKKRCESFLRNATASVNKTV